MERFVKFIPARGHTGHQLADLLIEFIEDNGISLKDLRGQCNDNASNMSGKYKDMKATFLPPATISSILSAIEL